MAGIWGGRIPYNVTTSRFHLIGVDPELHASKEPAQEAQELSG